MARIRATDPMRTELLVTFVPPEFLELAYPSTLRGKAKNLTVVDSIEVALAVADHGGGPCGKRINHGKISRAVNLKNAAALKDSFRRSVENPLVESQSSSGALAIVLSFECVQNSFVAGRIQFVNDAATKPRITS